MKNSNIFFFKPNSKCTHSKKYEFCIIKKYTIRNMRKYFMIVNAEVVYVVQKIMLKKKGNKEFSLSDLKGNIKK